MSMSKSEIGNLCSTQKESQSYGKLIQRILSIKTKKTRQT